jgi:histone H3/H4
MHRIITKAGGERISEAAAYELQKVLEEIGSMIANEALVFMKHAQRVTVKDVDIRIAAEQARHKLKY